MYRVLKDFNPSQLSADRSISISYICHLALYLTQGYVLEYLYQNEKSALRKWTWDLTFENTIVGCKWKIVYMYVYFYLSLLQPQNPISSWNRVPTHPVILEKFLNFILKVPDLEIYLNFVHNSGILCKTLEKVLLVYHSIILLEFHFWMLFSIKICEWFAKFL